METTTTPFDTIDFAPDYSAPPVPMELPTPGIIGDEL